MNNVAPIAEGERAIFAYLFHCARYEGAAGMVDLLEGEERESERALYESRAAAAHEGMERAATTAARYYDIDAEKARQCIHDAAGELNANPTAPMTSIEMLTLAKAAGALMQSTSLSAA